MVKVMCVFGTRPEAIKMAPIVNLLSLDDRAECVVCVTAQHREMLDQVLKLFSIQPDYDLNIMQPNQSLSQITISILERLDPIIKKIRPDWILAQGDTTTVMVVALLSYYNRIHFGHVEAGLRTWDKYQPYPEEVNRRVAGVIADLHFAPTQWACDNLLRENVPSKNILLTGNTVIDAVRWVEKLPCDYSQIKDEYGLDLKSLDQQGKNVVLITAHRRENFGKPLQNICEAVLSIADHFQDKIHFIYPVHSNPNIKSPVHKLLGHNKNITLTSPLDYLTMINIMKHSKLVLTDSGGLQEEAPGLGIPVLVLREVTERPEGVEAGTVRLVGTNPEKIYGSVLLLLNDPGEYSRMATSVNPYGDGHAAERIVGALVNQ
jgi:UDP-N-acetylglucosamine 2-epimerase (non-hydrolysing)